MQQVIDLLDPAALVEMVVNFVPRVVAAVGVLLVFWALLKLTQPPLHMMLRRAAFADALITLLIDNAYRFVVLGFGLVMAASQLGINIGAALAGIGVLGIAFGFAAQESVANTIAGFLIFWDKPFQLGHVVETQGEYGTVTEITMRTTRIRTPRNTYVVVPNRKIIEDVLVNHSMYGQTRVDVPIGIAYKESIPEARRVLLEAAAACNHVLADPVPRVIVRETGDSSVNLRVQVWVDDATHEWPAYYDVLEACKLALDRADIEIPFPHLQLFWEDMRSPVVDKLRTLRAASGP